MRWMWLLALPVVTGCWGDSDRFNRKQADLLCKLEQKCNGDFGVGDSPGLSCEDQRVAELSECAASCSYDEDAARSCIRGIKQALRPIGPARSCEYREGTIDDCARVYTDCSSLPDEGLDCGVQPPDLSCAVVADATTPWLLVLAIALPIRRRLKRP